MRRGTRRGQQAILLLGFLAAMCATNAQAQIGCSTRSEPPGTKSIACGVRSAHRMGAADASRYGYGGGSYGRGSYSSSSADEASEILPYLSPGCAELNDAMRTGPSRGVHGDVLSQLQREYRTKCGDEESLAYQRLRDEQSNQRGAAVQARQALVAQKQLSAQESARCDELLRILAGKRKRVDGMSEGEKADLQRSEEAFQTRCRR
jgi:hypothetical protein